MTQADPNILPVEQPVKIAAFYCFVPLGDIMAVRDRLKTVCEAGGIKGTVILAQEGYNGTMAGPDQAIDALVAALIAIAADGAGTARAEIKYARAAEMPFGKLKLRIKREIVTLGVPDLDFVEGGGTYVDPADWNALIADPSALLVDTRNQYEVGIGSFDGAMNPATRSFTEFPQWLADLAGGLSEEERRERPLAMFCTGGIRCEKSTALARSMGFGRVYHLKGGILAYLEQVDTAESRWHGDCFVFDERVAVTHGLAPGTHMLCKECGMPVAMASAEAHKAECLGG